MKKAIILTIFGVITLIMSIILFKHRDDMYEKIKLGDLYSGNNTIELDLDGDKKNETITIYENENKITINNKDFIVNTMPSEIENYNHSNQNSNHYYFVDLNKDGIIEIINDTSTYIISPPTHNYTILNYKNDEVKDIGAFSIFGVIPETLSVKGNIVKFEYTPFESKKGYTEEIAIELDI